MIVKLRRHDDTKPLPYIPATITTRTITVQQFFTIIYFCCCCGCYQFNFPFSTTTIQCEIDRPVIFTGVVPVVQSFTLLVNNNQGLGPMYRPQLLSLRYKESYHCCRGKKSQLLVGGGTDGGIIIIIADDDDGDDLKNELDILDGEDDDEEDDDAPDPYLQVASSEFTNTNGNTNSSDVSTDMVLSSDQVITTSMDWGGALGKLRQRFDDIEQGKSGNPSQALFRLMSAQSPNQAIGTFIQSANPQVVQAMSSAVTSLLGGLSSPSTGIETIVKATGAKIGTLCFQLQMTGYMFRNVEYVIALKKLMKIRGSATLQDYKDAFDRFDTDKSGYIESSEVSKLLEDVYDGKVPDFEIEAFIKFFDKNNDGKVSWDEFEKGLGVAMASQRQTRNGSELPMNLLPQGDNEDDDDDNEISLPEPEVSGTIQIEFKNGKVVEVDAKEYIESLKAEAIALKEALAKQNGRSSQQPKGMIQ